MGGTRPTPPVRCTYCGARGDGARADGRLLEIDLRGVRYDYCDAACATAHRQAVVLTRLLCVGCDEHAVGDAETCAEHLLGPPVRVPRRLPLTWPRAG